MDILTMAIAARMSGSGGSGLPVVTESDNGKVLQVVDGAWHVADVSQKIDEYIEDALGGEY